MSASVVGSDVFLDAAGCLSCGQALGDVNRLAALGDSGLMDSLPDPAFDHVTELVRLALRCEVALVSLVDERRQFFKSAQGLSEPFCSVRETPLTHSFCQYVVTSGRPLCIRDAREVELVRENVAVRELGVVSYLGMPIVTRDGFVLGSLCAINGRPREWSEEDVAMLRTMAAGVSTEVYLLSLASVLRGTIARMEEVDKQRDEGLHMLVHDLRTPLGAVVSILSLLKAGGKLRGEEAELLGMAQESGDDLLKMINGLLEVNRLQSGRFVLNRERLGVFALLRQVVHLAFPLAQEAGLAVEVVYPQGPCEVVGDEGLLSRVLLNLVTNALKYCPRGSRVVLSAATVPGGVEFAVQDDGPGVPDEDKLFIFERYLRGRAAANKGGGASFGLGLNFCKLAVEAHGGTLAVLDAPGGGSRFCFTISA